METKHKVIGITTFDVDMINSLKERVLNIDDTIETITYNFKQLNSIPNLTCKTDLELNQPLKLNNDTMHSMLFPFLNSKIALLEQMVDIYSKGY